ncbi:MAG: polymorphic toxin type 23 domain-containing protein [Bacteroidota bacterium]
MPALGTEWIDLTVTGEALALGSASDLGMPGPKATGASALGVRVRLGSIHTLRHEVAYRMLYYGSTDETSHWSGSISYAIVTPSYRLEGIYENDNLAWQGHDSYRTFAGRIRMLWPNGAEGAYGIGASVLFWTGSIQGLGYGKRGQFYDMTGQHGGQYSHGIVSLDGYLHGWKLSVGIDAEAIRTVPQDVLHWVVEKSRIPAVDRPTRLYVQLGWRVPRLLF